MNNVNGFWLMLPFLAVRFGLLAIVNKNAIQRAGHFAPRKGHETLAYHVYQISNLGLFIKLFAVTVKADCSGYFYLGGVCYLLGLILCGVSVVCFASPNAEGLNINGIYRFSRNPMYVGYFICFVGMSLLTQSFLLLLIVVIFQISAHWIILSEERWCLETFGESYREYSRRVRRYIGISRG